MSNKLNFQVLLALDVVLGNFLKFMVVFINIFFITMVFCYQHFGRQTNLLNIKG